MLESTQKTVDIFDTLFFSHGVHVGIEVFVINMEVMSGVQFFADRSRYIKTLSI